MSVEDDNVWNKSGTFAIAGQYQLAWQGAAGAARALWDEKNTCMYPSTWQMPLLIDTTSETEWEQDSIEVFVKESADGASAYQEGDGQYRMNLAIPGIMLSQRSAGKSDLICKSVMQIQVAEKVLQSGMT